MSPKGDARAVCLLLLGLCALPRPASAQNAISTGTKAGFRMFYTGSNDWWLDPSQGRFDIRMNGGAPLATVNGQGNLGVGTTSPAGLFQVGGGTITALANGNVGIGTTSPQAPLDVSGLMRVLVWNFPSDPPGGSEGEVYYNISSHTFRAYEGAGWTNLLGSAQTATKLAFLNQPASAVSGGYISTPPGVQVVVLDASSNKVTSSFATVTMAIQNNPPGNGTLYGTLTQMASNGVATFPDLWIDKVGTGYTLAASAAALPNPSVGSASFNITPGPAAQLAFTPGPPSSVSAGAPFGVAVTVEDAAGNTVTNFSGSVTVAFSANPVGGTLSGTLTATASNGVAGFSGLSINKAGSGYVLSASASGTPAASGGIAGTAGSPFAVTPAAATKLAVSGIPSSITAGTVSSVTVTALDSSGNVSTGYAGTVHFTSSDGQAALPGNYTFLAADNGSHVFTGGVTLKTAGTQSVTATDTQTQTITGAQTGIAVSVAAASQLAFGTNPQTVVVGACSPQASTVQSRDAYGNASNVASPTTLNLSGPGLSFYSDSGCTAAVSAVTIVANSNTASFYFKSATATGPISITATAAAPSTLGSATQTQTISALPPSQLAFTSLAQTVTAGSCSGQATVQSQNSNGSATNVTSPTSISLSGPSGMTFYSDSACQTSATAVTIAANSNIASFYFKDTAAGSALVTASGGTLTAASQTETINPGQASQLAFTVQPANSTAGAAISPAPAVTAEDAYGNTATGFTGTVTMTIGANPGNGTLSGTVSVAASAGVAIFSTLSINNVGNGYTLVATAVSLSTTSSAFNVAGCSNGTSTLTYTGSGQTVTVPSGCGTATVKLWGAGGGGGSVDLGGGGGFSSAALSVTPGTSLAVLVGGGGVPGSGVTGGAGGYGGGGGGGGVTGSNPGSGGGGRSAIGSGGVELITAAGGGGADGYSIGTFIGGVGGGGNGSSYYGVGCAGLGATSTAGGAAATVTSCGSVANVQNSPAQSGSALTGGNGSVNDTYGGGGGGGGYYGGGGGARTGTGGGGSNFAPSGGTTTAGSGSTAANTGDPAYVSGVGMGGSAGMTGGNGYVVIVWGSGRSGPATKLAFIAAPPSNVSAGAILPAVSVAVQDASGTTVGYAGNVTLALGLGSPAGTLSGTLTQPVVNGVATFSNLSIAKAGSGYTLAASAAGLAGATSGAFTVSPGPAASLSVSGIASSLTAGTASNVTVTALDAYGNTATGYLGTVRFASSDGQASLPGNYSFLSGDAGSHAFTGGATLKTVGTQSVTATDTVSPSIRGSESGIVVAPASASQLAFTVQPGNTATGAINTPAPQVTAKDAYGNTATSFNATVTMTTGTSPSGGALAGTTQVVASAGVAVFSNLILNNPGAYTLVATAVSLSTTSSAFSFTGTACGNGTSTFTYTGSGQTVTVPSGCGTARVKLWGAGGGGGSVDLGGGGGFSSGTISVTPGTSLAVLVGGGGVPGSGVTGGAGGYGGGGGGGGVTGSNPGSGGGGRSAIGSGGVELITAAGGGGADGYSIGTFIGGVGGGGNGSSYYGVGCAGLGATSAAGGVAGNTSTACPAASVQVSPAQAGSALTGGNGSVNDTYGGGGGGGGYYGGGGGARTGTGGGGSNFAPSGGTTTAGSGSTAANTGDPAYVSGVGMGGSAGVTGGNGYVVITWSF